MATDEPPGSQRQPTQSLADLTVPQMPANVPLAERDDVYAASLLKANGYGDSTADLLHALDNPISVLQAAAARALGARGEQAAIGALERLAANRAVEETVQVQATEALARLHVPGATEKLAEFLQISPETTPAPLQAAAALARLGRPEGFRVVLGALQSSNPVTVMTAVKQLLAFVSLDGQDGPDGSRVDIYAALERVMTGPLPRVAAEARSILRLLETPDARGLLEKHPQHN